MHLFRFSVRALSGKEVTQRLIPFELYDYYDYYQEGTMWHDICPVNNNVQIVNRTSHVRCLFWCLWVNSVHLHVLERYVYTLLIVLYIRSYGRKTEMFGWSRMSYYIHTVTHSKHTIAAAFPKMGFILHTGFSLAKRTKKVLWPPVEKSWCAI